MDFTNSNFLDSLLAFFQQHSMTGMLALQPHAYQLVCILAIIDFCTTWALYEGEARMSFMVSKIMKVSIFLFLVLNWEKINSMIVQSFQLAGATAAGITNVSSADWASPSNILNQGFQICGEIFEAFGNISIMSGGGLGQCFMYLIGLIITLASFFFIALQILLTKIEFTIFSSLGIILLPFGAIRFTNFLFQRVVSGVFAFAIKLMVMYFLLGLFNSLAGDLNVIPKDAAFSELLKIALSYAVLAFLIWRLPNLVASFMNGQPSMEAGDVIRGATSAKNTAATAVGAVTSGIGGAAVKATQSAGYLKATLNGAWMEAGASPTPFNTRGSSVAGTFAKRIARQSLANSRLGKALIQGANKAMNSHEDYKNIKSGKAFNQPQKNRNDYD